MVISRFVTTVTIIAACASAARGNNRYPNARASVAHMPRARPPSSPLRERDSPKVTGINGEVIGLYTSPRSGAPMQSRFFVELLKGKGIMGDRYALQTGSYSVLRWSAREPGAREPGRQLTIISADSIDESLEEAGLPSATSPGRSYGEFRRNVVVRGITAEQLMKCQGSEICLGPKCRVFVHRHCVPCFYNERLCNRPGQLEAIFDASGVSCEVLVGGPLNVGEQVTAASKWSPGQATVRDVGTQPPGYYIRPSKRSAAMARGAAQQMSTTLEELLTTDPNGVARVEAAYNSIGLGFWPTASWTPAKKTLEQNRRQAIVWFVSTAAAAGAIACLNPFEWWVW